MVPEHTRGEDNAVKLGSARGLSSQQQRMQARPQDSWQRSKQHSQGPTSLGCAAWEEAME